MLLAHLFRLFNLLRTWHQRYRTRRQLRELDAFARRDISISAEDVDAEARKPFWRT